MSDNTNRSGWPITLKNILKERNITQEEIAKSIGCSQSIIGHYLKGVRVPSFKRVADLAKAFNITPQELLFGGKSPETRTELKLLLEVPIPGSLGEILEFKEKGKNYTYKRKIIMEKTTGFIPAQTTYGIDITDDMACPYLFECKAVLPYPYKVIALIDPALKPHKGHAIIIEEENDFKIRQLQLDGSQLVTAAFDNSSIKKLFHKESYLGTIVSFALDYPPLK